MRQGTAWFEVSEVAANSYRVRLGGAFQGAWMASLSRRLAERRLSIDHTHARLQSSELWIAELHLIAVDARGLDPLELDYVALAQQTELGARPSFELDAYRLFESRDYDGTLMLTLEAVDTLGLLGGLLGALAELELVPIELHIETRGGRAYDCLWLKSSAGQAPSATTRAVATALLDGALRARG